jgi:hypothetical protein
MGMIYVFNKLKWKPPVATKYLTAPELELDLAYPDDSIRTMPEKQRTVFDTKFKASFDSKFNAMGQAKIKQIQEAIKWTEERIAQKAKPEEKEEVVQTANKLLKQAFDTWQSEMQKTCDECVAKAYEDSVKAMKMKLIKAQIKSVAKIVLIAGLILTAAALVIAASVATGGALTPLILGAIATGGAALYKAYKVYSSEWATSSNKIKEIQGDIKKLEAGIKTYQKLEKIKSGKLDKVKAFKESLLSPITDLDKHVGQLDKFIFEMNAALMEQHNKLTELANNTKDANAPEVVAAVRDCQGNIEKAADSLKGIEDCKAAAVEIKTQYNAQKVPDFGKLSTALNRIAGSSSVLMTIGQSLKTAFTALKKLGVAIPT